MHIDEHHTVEDIGIVLGEAFAKALGDKRGIVRYGFFILPMDEALATVAIDFAGRYSFQFSCPFTREKVGDLSTELVLHFGMLLLKMRKLTCTLELKTGQTNIIKLRDL